MDSTPNAAAASTNNNSGTTTASGSASNSPRQLSRTSSKGELDTSNSATSLTSTTDTDDEQAARAKAQKELEERFKALTTFGSARSPPKDNKRATHTSNNSIGSSGSQRSASPSSANHNAAGDSTPSRRGSRSRRGSFKNSPVSAPATHSNSNSMSNIDLSQSKDDAAMRSLAASLAAADNPPSGATSSTEDSNSQVGEGTMSLPAARSSTSSKKSRRTTSKDISSANASSNTSTSSSSTPATSSIPTSVLPGLRRKRQSEIRAVAPGGHHPAYIPVASIADTGEDDDSDSEEEYTADVKRQDALNSRSSVKEQEEMIAKLLKEELEAETQKALAEMRAKEGK